MAITERPDAANDGTVPRADPAPAQPAAPYIDCLTPLLEKSEEHPGHASRPTGWPEKAIGECRFGFRHPEMAWPDDEGSGIGRAALVVAAIAAGVIVLAIVLRSVIG